jgi:hypothetical protein
VAVLSVVEAPGPSIQARRPGAFPPVLAPLPPALLAMSPRAPPQLARA